LNEAWREDESVSSTTFQVVYDGPALAGSTIDVRELAPALLAFGDVIEQANFTLNDGRTSVALRVNASFKSGCFGIDFSVVQSLMAQMAGLFKEPAVVSAKEVSEQLGFVYAKGAAAFGGVLYVIKWLRNRKIKRVVLLDNGKARIELDDDELETEQRTIALLRNFKLRQALEAAVAKPLEREGYESVAIAANPEEGFVTVTRAERGYFVAPPPETEELEDQISKANLQLVSVAFKDDNKWRFYDGTTQFHAAILDERFVHRVQSGEENFAAGDILTVMIRKRQWLEADVMKAEHEVVEVLSHRRGMAQIPLVFAGAGSGGD
jgi:hypothetical protein